MLRVRAMSSKSDYDDATRERMWKLHPVERLSALAVTVVQCNPRDTRAAIKGFLGIAEAMARSQSMQTRVTVANDLRDMADKIERPALEVGRV